MNIIGWIRFGLKGRKAVSAIKKELTVYDAKKTLWKGFVGLLIGAGAAGAQAFADWLANAPNVMAVLEAAGLSKDAISGVTPIVVALALMVVNYLKHRG